MSKRLADLAAAVAWVLMAVALLATLAMTVHTLADVIARYFFRSPIPGTMEIATHYYLIPMTFLPLASVELRREHIVVEAFTHFLPQRWTLVLDAVVRILCIVILLVFAWRTGMKALVSTHRAESETAVFFHVAIWPMRWVLPLSFAAFALAMLSNLFRPKPPEDYLFEEGV